VLVASQVLERARLERRARRMTFAIASLRQLTKKSERELAGERPSNPIRDVRHEARHVA
jgi:hypothetical protein